jgi:hypothetical protein
MPKSHHLLRKSAVALVLILTASAVFMLIREYRDRASMARVDAALKSDEGHFRVGTLSRSTKASDRRTALVLQKEYDARFSKFLERHPELIPQWKSVPDHQNGFLQWLDFYEAHRNDGEESLGLPAKLESMISGKEPWDGDYIAAQLEDHRDLLAEVARIGLLPDQSTANISIDRYSFIGARMAKQSADLLMAAARLAAEGGDADLARERVAAAFGIARHFTDVETPSLLMVTVCLLVKLNAEQQLIEHVLPALGFDQVSLAEWLGSLPIDGYDTAQLSKTIRSEASISIRGFVIPILEGKYANIYARDVPDADLLMDEIAGRLSARADEIEKSSIADLWQPKRVENYEVPGALSPGAGKIHEIMFIGTSAWSRGWARAASMHSQVEAALAILTGAEVPPEAITGLPFEFDPVSRVLSHPDDERLEEISADPITLP